LRCHECSDCGKCKKRLGAEHFDGTAKLCRGCEAQDHPYQCDVCTQELNAAAFDSKHLKNAQGRSEKRVCDKCREEGFCPKDCEGYPCEICTKIRGHVRYDRNHLSRWKSAAVKERVALICDGCRKSHERILCIDAIY
jgi:hypothetical protein